MRLIIIVIIIAALGYFGYKYYEENMAEAPAEEAVIDVEAVIDSPDEPLEELPATAEEGEAVVEELVEEGEAMADDAGAEEDDGEE